MIEKMPNCGLYSKRGTVRRTAYRFSNLVVAYL
jgi:hypothetical protein